MHCKIWRNAIHNRSWCGERYRRWRGVACNWRWVMYSGKTDATCPQIFVLPPCTVAGEDVTSSSREQNSAFGNEKIAFRNMWI